MHVAICGNVFLQAQGNVFDIHSITIGDILFGVLNRQIFEFENPSPVLSKKDSLRNQILFFATKRTCAASPCMKVSCSAPMVLPQLPTAFVIQALTPSYSSVYGGSTSYTIRCGNLILGAAGKQAAPCVIIRICCQEVRRCPQYSQLHRRPFII